jgi:putative redox protein
MTKVIANNSGEQYKTSLNSLSNQFFADEPESNGGTDEGFSPGEFLASALASCTCITLRMYADRKKWNLDSVETEINFTFNNENKISFIQRSIKLSGNLSEEEKQRLLSIAEKCFIHNGDL